MASSTRWCGAPTRTKPRAIGIFARIMGAPGDRNLISFSINGGIELQGAVRGAGQRHAWAWASASAGSSNSAIKLDRDQNAFGTYSRRSGPSETFLELTYQYSVAPWWQVQPDFQYVWTPGGGITNPLDPAKRIGNEAIFGVRTSVVF